MSSQCQVCGTVLDASGEGVRVCPTCKQCSHEECWNHLGGCLDPNCRKTARKAAAKPPPGAQMPVRRQQALIRRRLAWILAQELRMAPEYHPDERKYKVGAGVCVLAAGVAEVMEVELMLQLFGPGALLFGGLLLLHRRQRRKGYIHRWIPAGPAPDRALKLADWIVEVSEGGNAGRPAEQFGQDFVHDARDKDLLEDGRRFELLSFAKDEGGKRRILVGEVGRRLLDEARRRKAPDAITRID